MYQIRKLALCEIEEIYQGPAVRHFPAVERKPMKSIRRMYEEGCYEALSMYQGEQLAAYAFYVTTPDREVLLLDYYAVLEEYRSSGTGSLFLQKMQEEYHDQSGILLETEDLALAKSEEERQTRTRRNAFYVRNGVQETQIRASYCGADYQIFYLPIGRQAEEPQIREWLEKIYRVIFREKYDEYVVMSKV